MTGEIRFQELDASRFIKEKVAEIKASVGEGTAINALSGGVDSSTVTMLGHRALGSQLRNIFVENGLMREGEADKVVGFFAELGVHVEVVDATAEFFLEGSGAFQYLAVLHQDRVTGIRHGGRGFGRQIEVRCWDSVGARTASPTRLPYHLLETMAGEIIATVPEVVSVTYNIASKPPSTIEAI